MNTGRLFPLDVTQLPGLFFGGPGLRIEEYTDGDTYIVRAEAPGVDPEKDIKVTFDHGRLGIRIERVDQRTDKLHTEFHYGAWARSIQLPTGTKEDGITASYEDGILEIRVPVADKPATGREIPVKLPGQNKK